MKIAFDIDGTYLEYPEVFDELALMLQDSGHEVGFLTGRDVSEEIETGFEPDFKYYLGLDKEETPDERCMAKATKMLEEGIDMTYDDEADFFPDYVMVIKVI